MFDRKTFDAAIQTMAARYEKTAPTVEAYADWLAGAADADVTLADVMTVAEIASELPPANYAANKVYHLAVRMGRDTAGHAGF